MMHFLLQNENEKYNDNENGTDWQKCHTEKD